MQQQVRRRRRGLGLLAMLGVETVVIAGALFAVWFALPSPPEAPPEPPPRTARRTRVLPPLLEATEYAKATPDTRLERIAALARRHPRTEWRFLGRVRRVPVYAFAARQAETLTLSHGTRLTAHTTIDRTAVITDLDRWLERYPDRILDTLDGFVVCGDIETDFARNTAGLCWDDAILLETSSTGGIWPSLLHHELAHQIYARRRTQELTRDWIRTLPEGFCYDQRALFDIRSPTDAELEAGFTAPRAKASLTEDFAEIVEILVPEPGRMAGLRARHERIDRKAQLATEFLRSVGVRVD